MRRWTVALLPWVWLSACGGGGENLPLADLDERIVTVQCDAEVRCNRTPSREACESTVRVQIEQLTADVAAGRIQYNGVAAADCLAFVASAGCNLSESFSEAPPSCRKAFEGTLAGGAPCIDDEECLSESCTMQVCDPTTQCCQGTCAPATAPIAMGGDCSADGAQCATGLHCNGSSVCAARATEGKTCSSFNGCVQGLWCSPTTSTCTRFPKRGQLCADFDLPCDAQAADSCDPATNTCVARRATGFGCQRDDQCLLYAKCDLVTRTCVARGGVGAPCADETDCLLGLTCPNGACAQDAPRPVCPLPS